MILSFFLSIAYADINNNNRPIENLATKLVNEFQKKELELNEILLAQDKIKASKYFSKNFELIFSEVQSHTSNLDNAFQDFRQNKNRLLSVNDLSARELNGSILVNFTLRELNNRQHNWFVVDVWTKHNNDCRLEKRYISSLKGNRFLPPGFVTQEVIKKKY